MKNVEELRDELAIAFRQLKSGEIKHSDADSLANIAGKMIASVKAQLEYHAMRKEVPVIAFLESGDKK